MKGISTLVLFLASFMAFARGEEGSAVISGTVTTADGKPAPYVTVQVKGSNKSALTDEEGIFVLRNLPAGTYDMEISLIGYETVSQTVTVSERETASIRIELKLSGKQLDEVTVSSGRRKFVRTTSDYVGRLPLRNLENPQVYTTITRELLQEQVVTNFNDAVKNAPGINKLWSSTGRGGDGAAYFALRGFSVQPTMINSIAGVTNGGLDPANIEKIEVIKGPSGTLFGSSLISFGGLINIVTKKPYDHFGGEVSYTAGSFGLSRMTADINTPLGKSNNVLLRVNGSYHSENSFQDAGFKKSWFIAPSLSYQVNERFSIGLNTEFFDAESTNPLMVFLNRSRKLAVTTPDALNMDPKRSFTSDDVTIRTPTFNIMAEAKYKLSDQWTSQTVFSRSNRKSDGFYQYVMFILPGDALLHRYLSDQYSTSLTTDIQQNFIGDFRIGALRNRIVAGLDYYTTSTINSSSPYILFDTVNAFRPDARYTQLSRAALDARFAQSGIPVKTTTTNSTYSAYVSDVLNVTDRLIAMLSLRVDRFDNKGTYNMRTNMWTGDYTQTSLSPKLGLVYQLVPQRVSLFANYMNGFRNVADYTQPDGTVSNFGPQQADQWEGGVKLNLVNGRLSGSLSYYDIFVENVVRPDPFKAGFNIQDGNVSSKGLEAELIATPARGLNIVAGYSYNRSLNDQTDSSSIGRRPVSAGPEQLVNAWVSYQLTEGKLKGLGIGAGGNYASENIITNTSVTGQFILTAYTVLNASLFYNMAAFRFGLKVDNIANRKYYKGWTTVEPQMPRRVSANLVFKF